MIKLLALDTSQDACSVALLKGDEVDECLEIAPKQQSQLILPMVKAMLDKHNLSLQDLDAVCVSTGPGSFTGVRLGVCVAQGLCYGAGLPLIGVATLEAMALRAMMKAGAQSCFCAMDARMKQVFCAHYDRNFTPMQGIEVLNPDQVKFEAIKESCVMTGNGFDVYPELFEKASSFALVEKGYPRAKYVALRAKALYPEHAKAPELCQPLYVRDNVIQS